MNKPEMPKIYDPKGVEDKIYAAWEASGFFNPDNSKGKETFSIVMPPPNVTGTLHIGHAVMLAIEDIMVRFARMQGKKTLWLPGTDHAAIATQAVVEKKLIKEGIDDPRRTLGRDAFLKKVEEFAQASHDRIVEQVKKMGSSCDWSREAFTLDEPRSFAVRTVFKKMYDDGLIYRGNRIVNWCPHCKSTLSDDEIEYIEKATKFYTFRYDEKFPFAISTTRPETKLGDTAVAVSPEDHRYKDYIGKVFEVELVPGKKQTIKIIAENEVDPEFGTGALGVTPAHSMIDFEMANRNNLPVIKVIGEDGLMTAEAEPYAGMTVEDARRALITDLEKRGLVEKTEDMKHNLSICYRCGTPVEPLPKLQWFIDVKKEVRGKSLKDRMREVVTNGSIKIIPNHFEKIYLHWIDNLRDWCISRQIWYGHRIPVWYRGTEIYVGVEPPQGDDWIQDEDTLDTWFSSGLWTFSTLGWPANTKDFKIFHPTTVLETGYDIIFFWVARMILMTTYVLDDVPFKNVYLHGLVRDEQGRKMSKSLGNVIDPLTMIEKYGADATRLALVIGTGPGNDSKLSEAKIAGYRNFTNKLWNISRFVISSASMGEDKGRSGKPTPKTLADSWILSELEKTINEVTNKLEGYEFSIAGELLREFTWNSFADWYLEISKLQIANTETEKNTKIILIYCLENILKLWHPFMPFVTENIWELMGKEKMLIVEPWPESKIKPDKNSVDSFGILKELISSIRNIRADYDLPPKEKFTILVSAGKNEKWLKEQMDTIKNLADVEKIDFVENFEKRAGFVVFVVGGAEVAIDLAGVIDTKKEQERIGKEIDELQKYISGLEVRLSNQDFIARAPANVIEAEKTRLKESAEKLSKLESQLKNLDNF